MLTAAVPSLSRRLVLVALMFAILVTAGYQYPDRAAAAQAHSLTGTATRAAARKPAAHVTTHAANQAAFAVFHAINIARHNAHLAPLKWAAGLYRSALVHNVGMARDDELSHKLTNEAAFGSRISAQHVSWTNAGENIGWISNLTTAGAVSVNAAMLAEKAPADGHRLNLLSPSFNTVGVNVIIDSAHSRLWLTEDFTRS